MSVAVALIAAKPRLAIVFRRDWPAPQPNRMAALERIAALLRARRGVETKREKGLRCPLAGSVTPRKSHGPGPPKFGGKAVVEQVQRQGVAHCGDDAMKKIKFDNSLSLQQAFAGRQMPPILILEGWLVDDHVCVQKPSLENGSDWRVSLYPWGHVLSFDFYAKSDATEFAKDVCKLRIDWKFIHSSKPIGRSPEYKRALAQIRALRNQYEADGFFKPRHSMPLVATVGR